MWVGDKSGMASRTLILRLMLTLVIALTIGLASAAKAVPISIMATMTAAGDVDCDPPAKSPCATHDLCMVLCTTSCVAVLPAHDLADVSTIGPNYLPPPQTMPSGITLAPDPSPPRTILLS